MKNPTSKHVLCSLMHYIRYKRGWVCADEVRTGRFNADLLVDTNKDILEIEIKVTKNDLYGGEARKNLTNGRNKHDDWKSSWANKFALCVPTYLEEDAKNWIKEKNDNYGLFIYRHPPVFKNLEDNIRSVKTPKLLHKSKTSYTKYEKKILMRLASSRCNALKKGLKYET